MFGSNSSTQDPRNVSSVRASNPTFLPAFFSPLYGRSSKSPVIQLVVSLWITPGRPVMCTRASVTPMAGSCKSCFRYFSAEPISFSVIVFGMALKICKKFDVFFTQPVDHLFFGVVGFFFHFVGTVTGGLFQVFYLLPGF